MSGVWGGWLKRLRKGQAAEPPVDHVAHRVVDEAPEVAADAPDPQSPTPDIAAEDDPDESGHGSAAVVQTTSDAAPGSGQTSDTPPPDVHALLRDGQPRLAREAAAESGETAFDPLIDAIVEGEAVLHRLGHADPSASGGTPGIMLAPSRGRRDLLVVFGTDGGGFAVPREAALGRRPHLLFVQDPRHCLAMLGVGRLGATYDDCLLAILGLMRALDAREVFCAGSGAACYSALRYGLDLGAAGVLAMGALTRIERAPGLRPGSQRPQLLRLAAELGPDLNALFARAAPRPGLVLCRAKPKALAGLAALPGAIVSDAPADAGADLLDWADRTGQLRGLVRELLGCKAVG